MVWHMLSILAQLFGTLAAITRLCEFFGTRILKKTSC